MLNSNIMDLGVHPFIRTDKLLSGLKPNSSLRVIDVTIGEPQFPPPSVIGEIMRSSDKYWGSYPPNNGPAEFRYAVSNWLESRYDLPQEAVDSERNILPFAGAREALFQVGFLADSTKQRKKLFAMPTPHYAPYRAAAIMCGWTPFYISADETSSYLPDLDIVERYGESIAICLVCSPSNPEGAIASEEYLERAVTLARKFNFLLVVDECYSEIYFESPPPGILKAAYENSVSSDNPFKNVLSINSLSKRSSAAGLRVAFACGDKNVIGAFSKLRGYCGGTAPVPNLLAASMLYRDEAHVRDLRELYKENVRIIDSYLRGVNGYSKPKAGMFLWLKVKSDEDAAVEAWRRASLRVIPGGYLGPDSWDGHNVTKKYIRIALVYSADITNEVGKRLRTLLASSPVFTY